MRQPQLHLVDPSPRSRNGYYTLCIGVPKSIRFTIMNIRQNPDSDTPMWA